jgi:hypothetical protein
LKDEIIKKISTKNLQKKKTTKKTMMKFERKTTREDEI